MKFLFRDISKEKPTNILVRIEGVTLLRNFANESTKTNNRSINPLMDLIYLSLVGYSTFVTRQDDELFDELNKDCLDKVLTEYKRDKRNQIGREISHSLQSKEKLKDGDEDRFDQYSKSCNTILTDSTFPWVFNNILDSLGSPIYYNRSSSSSLLLSDYEYNKIIQNANPSNFKTSDIVKREDINKPADKLLLHKLVWFEFGSDSFFGPDNNFMFTFEINNINFIFLAPKKQNSRAHFSNWNNYDLSYVKVKEYIDYILNTPITRKRLDNSMSILNEHIIPDLNKHITKRSYVKVANDINSFEVINEFYTQLGGADKVEKYPFEIIEPRIDNETSDVKKKAWQFKTQLKEFLFTDIEVKYNIPEYIKNNITNTYRINQSKEYYLTFKFKYTGKKLEFNSGSKYISRNVQWDEIMDLEDIDFICQDITFHLRKYENHLKKLHKKYERAMKKKEKLT